ncbi:M-phase inducer phosphatase-like [Cylas formicarius]|uniref:M-phase inducer phosphatase-like n=1 Tax=Cylas formicarius TaxID=197179 RepID=UPI002958BCEF|nr:M-phase inducer phosphatase-like [Cylas formicarius]
MSRGFCDFPAADMAEFYCELSLYEDTTDSGFADEVPDFSNLLHGSLLVENDPEASVCFSPAKGDNGTPGKCWLTKKRRTNPSPEPSTPSKEAAFRLKRLKIFGLDDVACREHVKEAVEKSSTDECDLIGDFSKAYCLPTISGAHPDLKTISVDTMKDLIEGVYGDVLASYKIIDSRYPYEFEGGHIQGANNCYSKEECLKLLDEPRKQKDERHVLIFHCEFSRERGPNMYRHLRKEDRLRNGENYPDLCYPEIYVLDGGYKRFFESYPHLCQPATYTKMLHPEHEQDLRYFRQKSKTSEGDSKTNGRKPKAVRRFLSDMN